MSDKPSQTKLPTAGGFKAINYVMRAANKVGTRKLAAAVRSKNTCKACAFGTGGQRGGLHNEYSNRIEICNKNIQAQLSDIRDPIPVEIFAENSLDELRQLSGKQLEDLGRLSHPLHKTAGANFYQPISYERALSLIAEKLKASQPERCFFYGSGRSSNEAAFVLQLFARLFGCNHVNNCSYYCHQASGVGLNASIGTGTATIQYADLHKADLIFVLGANPASNHPRFVKVLLECRQRGGQVVVINPVREAGLVKFASPSNFKSMISGGGDVASHYVQPHVGGDVALLTGIAKHLIEAELIDQDFIQTHCENADEYLKTVDQSDWNALEQHSGVSREEMIKIAELYGNSKRSVFAWGMGLTHHRNGTENIEAVAALALLRGMIGGEGKGLLPLRGHSNVQGVSSMGLTPALKQHVFDAIEEKYSVSLPDHTGMDTLACVEAAAAGNVDVAFLLGGNLYAANPDSAFADSALSNIPFKVMINSTLNQTHINGVDGENIILPIRVRDEEEQGTTQESMFNYVRLSDGGFDRIAELMSEVEIITEIAAQVIPQETLDFNQFKQHSSIRKAVASLIPGFEELDNIDQSKREFHINGRHFFEPQFKTPTGRARLATPRFELESTRDIDQNIFALTTVRSEGQFNTIIYSEEDVYRGQTRRDVLFMNPEDMEQRGWQEGNRVRVKNSTGEMNELVLTSCAIKAGNVMTYFPEANVLVPRAIDERSRTPTFKNVAVEVSLVSE